jgi:hypothetical protein
MDNKKGILPSSEINSIKQACRVMYRESRTFPGTLAQQDTYLNMIINEFFKKALNKAIQDDTSKEKDLEDISEEFLLELKQLMDKWKIEFEFEVKNGSD